MKIMNKGIFFIPIYKHDKPLPIILDEVIDSVIKAEKWKLSEAFFGEHITDRHEKISSSLMMVSCLSRLSKKIKLGTLTSNLNFYKPAIMASLIALADNLAKGRLILGIS